MSEFRRRVMGAPLTGSGGGEGGQDETGLLLSVKSTILNAFPDDGNIIWNYLVQLVGTDSYLIPFINIDPFVILSLDIQPSGLQHPLPYRLLKNNNYEAYIDLELYPRTTSTLDIIFMAYSFKGYYPYEYPYIFGGETGDRLSSRFGLWHKDSQLAPRIGSWKTNYNINHLNKVTRVEWREDRKGYINGIYIASPALPYDIPNTVWLFAINCGEHNTWYDGSHSDSAIGRFAMDGNIFVPWTYTGTGIETSSNLYASVGDKGVINLKTGRFHKPSYNGDYFSICYAYQDGTTWIPN